jgi:hypothetical protein
MEAIEEKKNQSFELSFFQSGQMLTFFTPQTPLKGGNLALYLIGAF